MPNFQSLFVVIIIIIIIILILSPQYWPVSVSDNRLSVVSLRYNILVLHYYVQSINLVLSSLPMYICSNNKDNE